MERSGADYKAVRLYGTGNPVEEIIEVTDCSRRSLLRWSQRYRRDGLSGLQDRQEGGNRALLAETQVAEGCDNLHHYRLVDVLDPEGVATATGQHWTVPDLKRALQQWYGLVYQSSSSYRQLFALRIQLPAVGQSLSLSFSRAGSRFRRTAGKN